MSAAGTLRRDRVTTSTLGLPVLNIGVSKGSTYDRVLIFPTKAHAQYLKTADRSVLKVRERLCVAVARARHSIATDSRSRMDHASVHKGQKNGPDRMQND